MLATAGLSSFLWTYDNYGANPSVTTGTSVTPGATNAEGTYTQIASGANIANDVYWVSLRVTDGGTSVNAKNHLLDVGVDNAGGTSYTTVINNMVCGTTAAINASGGGAQFLFPLYIKAGSSVAVRVQGSNGTAGTVRVTAKFWGYPSNPELALMSQYNETIGTITNSDGPTFTLGNAADGTWVSLGTTSQPLWWWQLGVQVDDSTMTALQFYADLAYGDATNKVIIQRSMYASTGVETLGACIAANLNFLECYAPVPTGANIYVRGRASTTPDSNYNAVAIGFG